MLKSRKFIIISLSVCAVLVIAAIAAYAQRGSLAAWGYDAFLSDQVEETLADSYQPLPNRPVPAAAADDEEKTGQKPFSVLLMGLDARGNETGRSDTLIYTVVRPADGRVLMVSIPRDTYAEMAGTDSRDKIAHAYVYGGPEMTVGSVEKLLDARIDHYASINFLGFEKAVDMLGGIPLPITKDIVNRDPNHEKFTIKANQSSYSGRDALNFVRYREDAGGDVSRTERSRQFLESLIRKASSLGQWSKIPDILEVVGDHFRTDLRPQALSEMVKQFLQTDYRIQSYTLHGEGKRMGPNNLWYYVADEADLNAVRETIDAWLDPETPILGLTVPSVPS